MALRAVSALWLQIVRENGTYQDEPPAPVFILRELAVDGGDERLELRTVRLAEAGPQVGRKLLAGGGCDRVCQKIWWIGM